MNRTPYEEFPHIVTDDIIIRKMVESDLNSFFEICSNDNVYKYAPTFLYTKSRTKTATNIQMLGGRDFDKERYIIMGISLTDSPEKIVGTAQIFDYKKKTNTISIGYVINESYWGRGIATKTVAAMIDYLFTQIGINRIEAFVMSEHTKSQNVLIKNGFTKVGVVRQFWKGKGDVEVTSFSLLSSDYKK